MPENRPSSGRGQLRLPHGCHRHTIQGKPMKPFFTALKNFCPHIMAVILLLASLPLSSGCTEKQQARIGGKPPGISGNDIHGEFITLNQFKGKVVVLCFWANTCCGEKLKLLEPYYRLNKYRDLAVLAINVGDSKETVELYAKNNGVTFAMQTDEYGMIARQYGVFGFPTIFILDGNGIIRNKILGDIQIASLEKLVSLYRKN
jgi:peroxiredoxin